MNHFLDPTVREHVFEAVLPCGFHLHIVPKPGFAKTEAALAVAFGGVDRDIRLGGTGEILSFPEGTAHFLEHMLFESESDPLSDRFSACGASVNAYTAPTRTSYYFSTTNGLKEPLDLLLSLVLRPGFPEERVEKERKIIANEIRMYQDDLDQMLYQDTLASLFESHPVTTDIAGTEESIGKIDASLLRRAHGIFYHPAHLHLIVVGDVDPEAVLRWTEAHPALREVGPDLLGERILRHEDPAVRRGSWTQKRDVKSDLLMIGVKLDRRTPATPLDIDLEEIRLAFALDNVFGKTSRKYRDLMDRRLVNDAFEFSASVEADYGFLLVFTETKKAEAAKKALSEDLLHLSALVEDEERFEIAKKKMLGNFIQTFDHVSSLCSFLTEYYVSGVDPFDLLRKVGQMTFSDLRGHLPEITAASLAAVRYHP